MERYKVTVSNQLVRAGYSLNIVEKRVLLCLISRIPPKLPIKIGSSYISLYKRVIASLPPLSSISYL